MASVIGLSTYSSAAVADTGPKVVVSILPIHSLVQSVMDGVGDAELLVDQKASPHGYSLRPSQVRALNKADLIVWVGEGLETFLEKPLSQQPANTTVLELMDLKTIHLLENRTAGTWDEHHAEEGHGDHEEEGGHDHDENHNHGKYDPHIWLSLDNSRAIVKRVGSELVKIDPDNAQLYHKNVEVTLASLGLMKQDISAQMSNVKNKPYLVFHDAYQYFEQEFSLNSIGSVTIDPERKPGAKRLTELREHIRLSGAVCIFSEPQFKPAVVNVLSEGLAIKKGELDPMGSEFEAGKMAYGQLLNGLAGSITECLSD
ncbi:zinc ABC transporter substrate-binding protein ZnuA [Kiloniella sp.]|uniref:zinc ABC transporter substrate-binding protein ZnuA n=1 Tax=Kiloniella sp. TaxID=1938587 RepID=UPI003B02C806